MRVSPKNRQTMLVSFSGIDGAGKSTQIANLRARLEEAGLRVAMITFWDDVARLKRIREDAAHKLFKGDKGVGTPAAPIHRRDKNVSSPLMTLIRLGIYFVDAVSLRAMVAKALRSDADFVIFDRYIYDELANLNLGSLAARLYLRGIMKLAPRPQISFLLDADPAQACVRKPEYPLEFVHFSRNSYLTLSRLLGGITTIPPMPLERVKAEVVTRVLRQSFAHNPRNDDAEPPVAQELSGAEARLDGQSARPIVS
jgi:thymidylate kinase